MYTLVYSKWITNKDLLYSIRNSGNLDGKGFWRRMETHVCMAESLHHSPETIKTLLNSYTPIQNKKCKVWGKKEKRGLFRETFHQTECTDHLRR